MTTTTPIALDRKALLKKYPKVTVIGAGAMGTSWIALFLANGLRVTANDPRPDLVEATLKGLEEISPTLAEMGYDVKDLAQNLSFEKDVKKAVQGAALIQENGPEQVAFKQDLYAQIEENMNPDALVLSSSSSIHIPLSANDRRKSKSANPRILI